MWLRVINFFNKRKNLILLLLSLEIIVILVIRILSVHNLINLILIIFLILTIRESILGLVLLTNLMNLRGRDKIKNFSF